MTYLRDEQRPLRDLRRGEHGYMTPWSLHEVGGFRWLHPDHLVSPEPFGTSTMRVALLRGAYYAWPTRGDRVLVQGLRDYVAGEPAKVSQPQLPDDPAERVRVMAEQHEQLAAAFDAMDEPDMAADQRRIARQLRGTA